MVPAVIRSWEIDLLTDLGKCTRCQALDGIKQQMNRKQVWRHPFSHPNTLPVTPSVLVSQSFLTLCDPMDYILPGFSVRGIFQPRILAWVAILFSRRSSWPRNWNWITWIAGRFFTTWTTREAQDALKLQTSIQILIILQFSKIINVFEYCATLSFVLYDVTQKVIRQSLTFSKETLENAVQLTSNLYL